jgi:hypothetical protein
MTVVGLEDAGLEEGSLMGAGFFRINRLRGNAVYYID